MISASTVKPLNGMLTKRVTAAVEMPLELVPTSESRQRPAPSGIVKENVPSPAVAIDRGCGGSVGDGVGAGVVPGEPPTLGLGLGLAVAGATDGVGGGIVAPGASGGPR